MQNCTITLTDNNLFCDQSIFKISDVGRRIWYKTITGREYGIFDIVEYIDPQNVTVDIKLEPTSLSTNQWYFSATIFKGLEHLEGETVSVVGNGGYIGDFIVKNGTVDISSANVNKVGSAVIGLKYKGILKSCNLGMVIQGTQTFTTPKQIYKIDMNFNFSAGGKVGDSLYNLRDIQDFDPKGLFDVPPLPMDRVKTINYDGEFGQDKHYYVVQDLPLPFQLSMIVPHYKQVTET